MQSFVEICVGFDVVHLAINLVWRFVAMYVYRSFYLTRYFSRHQFFLDGMAEIPILIATYALGHV